MLQAYTVLGVFDDALFVADTLLADAAVDAAAVDAAAVDAAAVDAVAVVSTAVVGACGSFRRPTKSTKAASLAIFTPHKHQRVYHMYIMHVYYTRIYAHFFQKHTATVFAITPQTQTYFLHIYYAHILIQIIQQKQN